MSQKSRNKPRSPEGAQLLDYLDAFPRLRIGVLGDFAADRYLIGSTSRISREAPVLILKKRQDNILPGQAGNSAANLAAIGVECIAFGAIGSDAEGYGLIESLKSRNIDVAGIVEVPNSRTIVKTRILAGGHHAALQQVIRIDDDEGLKLTAAARRELTRRITETLPTLDAVLVSDYGYGTVDAKLWGSMGRSRAKGGKRLLRVLDSRYALAKFRDADVITPNETEVFAHLGIEHFNGTDAEAAGHRLVRRTRSRGLIMTRGNEGMIIIERGRATHLPIFGSDEVTDVTGAGDTVAAVVAGVRAAGGSLLDAARLANVAAGLAVMKLGAATVSPAEIREAILKQGCP